MLYTMDRGGAVAPCRLAENEGFCMKRTAIFVFWDADGVVYDYVLVFLRGLRAGCERILCMVNGPVQPEGLQALQTDCDEVICRPNEGLDVTAYKEGFFHIMEHPADEEELLFCNATVYGPVYPFSELFAVMEARKDLDFWGLSRHGGHNEDLWGLNGLGYIPEHIQSYFWAVRRRMFLSNDFADWWRQLPAIHTYQEAVSYHEMLFTRHFAQLGYRWDTFLRQSWYDVYETYQVFSNPVRLLCRQRCPVVKKKSFLTDGVSGTTAFASGAAQQVYDFLRTQTDYDPALIVQNLTHTENSGAYLLGLGLFVPPAPPKKAPDVKTALLCHFSDLRAAESLRELTLPANADLYLYGPPALQQLSGLPAGARVLPMAEGQDFWATVQLPDEYEYYAFLQVMPQVLDTNPRQAPRWLPDLQTYLHAATLIENLDQALAYLANDPQVAAVVPLPLTHRQHISPDPDWSTALQPPLAAAFGTALGPKALASEPLRTGLAAFVARRELAQTLCEKAQALQKLQAPPRTAAYLLPLCAQSMGRLVAFWATQHTLNCQVLTAESQLRLLTTPLVSKDTRREDQLIACASTASWFFHGFFQKASWHDRLYFLRLLLLNRRQFMWVQKKLHPDSTRPYPFDAYLGVPPKEKQ